jgi:SAM-dependent methyltransferase
MKSAEVDSSYNEKLAAEGRKWGDHLKVEASGDWHAWIDHPLINQHYATRCLVDGLAWDRWVIKALDGPAEKSLDLGCGAGSRSIRAFNNGATKYVEGHDVSEERIAEAERQRRQAGIPGMFSATDSNVGILDREKYDLIFSCHSFHHFLNLEHIMEQVNQALTPRGLFMLEEFVGPTQFQWTDQQIEIVKSLMSLIPERLRRLRWDAVKFMEGRPTVADVVAASPFESIRSAEILPLFRKYFEVVQLRNLGGTIQHLLYNGIIHNFQPNDDEALRCLQAIWEVEDTLIDSRLLPSDFMLLIGRRKMRR